MKKIDRAIEMVADLIKEYKNPMTYQEPEYYDRCSAKTDVLEDVLYNPKCIKENLR